MNTNRLKRFAQEARRKLIQQVGSRMELVLTTDSAELREKAIALNSLKDAIKNSSKEQVIDKVAYTWFNRLMALRFMDVNEYQPTGVKIVTPKEGYTLPEILEDARQGQIPDELPVNKEHIYDLLDGKIPSSNAQNEVYKELLIGACNQLHNIFPFLFEKIDDYTELLLPDDLTSEFSIIHEFMEGMLQEDCQEVEVIGWLYQFYISEKKDEVFASKSKVKKEDIPAATQLFTPRWIVEYMVQNTVGKLWLQNNPKSRLREHMEYFIESPSIESEDYLKIDSVEEITLLDQACGSGHILVYGFDLLSKIYEEEGYNPSEIPQLIIEKNLFGFEIDERAAQLAGFALMMKARAYHRRVFRKELKPNILQFEDVNFTKEELSKVLPKVYMDKSKEFQRDLELIKNATNFGSLIQPESSLKFLEDGMEEIENQLEKNPDLFLQDLLIRLRTAVIQISNLKRKYHCAVANPPYMGAAKMNKELSDWIRVNYVRSKSDLNTCFIERTYEQVLDTGYIGFVTMESWMFLSSFEAFRVELLNHRTIQSLCHFGWHIMRIAFGTTAFVLKNSEPQENSKGVYSYMDYKNIDKRIERPKKFPLESNGRYNIVIQNDFQKIPGNPVGYWLTSSMISAFKNDLKFEELGVPRQGLGTTNNARFVKSWFEVSSENIKVDAQNKLEAKQSRKKWFPYIKGGGFRRWYGNYNEVVNWENNGEEIRKELEGKNPNIPRSEKHYFKKGITWGLISSFGFSCRKVDYNCVFDVGGSMAFPEPENTLLLIAYLNSKITIEFLKVFSPTLNFQVGDLKKLPIKISETKIPKIEDLALKCISISEKEWNSKETSWDFERNELIRINGKDIEEAYLAYNEFWKLKYDQLFRFENKLNEIFIELYGLGNELDPQIPFKDVTILKEETKVNGKLEFDKSEVFAQFISYAVGCMFGRYSLDKEGLILANQGETLQDYIEKVEKGETEITFLPDDDNIIPVLDDEWFEDDIVGRFYEFLKASFGKENFDKNLAFVEECIGKDIRKYFVKDFYKDHIKRYKKRPIYWMFSSPKGSFNVLIYMHRYTPDTLNSILNGYLVEYREKLKARIEHLDHIIETGSSVEQTKAAKEKDRLRGVLLELQEYEREILYPLATDRISIDLDDGVLVNYNKFGKAIQEVKGLNDKKAKEKVKKFDWIATEVII